jgi:hypothetical protein
VSTDKRWLTPLVLVSWLVLCIEPAPACSVPVFRYALERWDASAYMLLMFHRGPLTPGDKALVDLVTKRSIDGGGKANVFIQTIDVSAEMDEFAKAAWESESNADLPLSVLRYPSKGMGDPGRVAWRGRLTKPLVELMLDSPARREIARQIKDGRTAVWVYLGSEADIRDRKLTRWLRVGPALGVAALLFVLFAAAIARRRYAPAGAALVALLAGLAALHTHWDGFALKTIPASAVVFEKLVKEAEEKVSLPEIDPHDQQWGPGQTPVKQLQEELKIDFSVVRVDRANPKERGLVHLLMGTESDLATEYADQPMAFAVFGRGRALPALVGKGITAKNVTEDCRFLTGPCSCTIKEQNPGIDTLMTTNWTEGLKRAMVQERTLPPLPALSQDTPPANAPATPPAAVVESPPPSQPATLAAEAKSSVARQAVILGAIVVLITIALVVYARKSSSGTQA